MPVEQDRWREDRRARRSRAAMMAAFERLALSRPPSEITVSALAGEAGVDRKTFYQHFGSMDGLLEARSTDMVNDVLDAVEAARAEGAAAGDEREVEAFFSAVTEALGEKVALSRNLLGSMPTEELLRHLEGPLERGITERGLLPGGLSERNLRYALRFELGGLVALYRAWALGDEADTLDETTRVACSLVGAGVRGVLPTV